MATVNKITEMIAAIKTIYPYYAKDTDVQMLVKTWNLLLKNYTDEAVEIAFYKCLQTCKMPPTPADVIEQLNSISEAAEQTEEEMWRVLTKTLRDVERQMFYIKYPKIGENARDVIQNIWEGLPDRLKQYIGSKGEMMRMADGYSDEDLKFEKVKFFKTMPTIKKREEYTELKALLGNNTLLIESKTEDQAEV